MSPPRPSTSSSISACSVSDSAMSPSATRRAAHNASLSSYSISTWAVALGGAGSWKRRCARKRAASETATGLPLPVAKLLLEDGSAGVRRSRLLAVTLLGEEAGKGGQSSFWAMRGGDTPSSRSWTLASNCVPICRRKAVGRSLVAARLPRSS